MAPTAKSSVLTSIGTFLGKLVAFVPVQYRPTQKMVAHAVTTALSAAAVAVLPLNLSVELNGVIVVVAGLVAHYIVPNGP